MSEPKLTIGIPTLDRPEMLSRAIGSALAQTLPVHILVADQGHTEGTAAVMNRYAQHPHVEHILTEATCIRQNWEAAARACDTPYFAWLQDDDLLSPIYASRVVRALDAFPQALHWQAYCHISTDWIHYIKGVHNGPQVAVRMDLQPEMWGGQMLLASMYCVGWALSPGVAFRCGEAFNAALEAMPSDCDLLLERLILAELGLRGPFVVDGVVAGYWNHHGKNESYKQNTDGTMPSQVKTMIDHLDGLLDRAENWREMFFQWLRGYSPQNVLGFLANFEAGSSRYADEIKAIMRQSLAAHGVTATPGHAVRDRGEDLLWTPADLDTMRVAS